MNTQQFNLDNRMQYIITAVGYFLFGKLALTLAIPPGYASPIWPAAGVALASVLLFGARVWPMIVIGSVLVNIGTSLDMTNAATMLRSFIIPTCIGLGAALQAVVGARLIRSVAGFPTNIRQTGNIVSAFFWGGPAACLINAIIGPAVLLVVGSIHAGAFAKSCCVWWVGDAIGVLIVLPLYVMGRINLAKTSIQAILLGCSGVFLE